MPHSVELITTIAAAFGLALIFGFMALRLELPTLVGYLLAGSMFGLSLPLARTVVLLKTWKAMACWQRPAGASPWAGW